MSKVFFSWQADRPALTGRNLVARALEIAVQEINEANRVEEADRPEIEVDSDTKKVPGTPAIFETILKKIEACSAFVADLTYVGTRQGKGRQRRSPNPNVLLEYGWALHARRSERVIAVMNTAYGSPQKYPLPFDLAHMRFPITYECPETADEATRQAVRTSLAKALKSALQLILELDAPPAPPVLPFERAQHTGSQARFRQNDEPIGKLFRGVPSRSPLPGVRMREGPAQWLRVMPHSKLKAPLLLREIEQAYERHQFSPRPLGTTDSVVPFYSLRGADGIGICIGADVQSGLADMVTYIFESGEIWIIDAATLNYDEQRFFFNAPEYAKSLSEAAAFLRSVGVGGPYTWIAGVEGVNGRRLLPVGRPLALEPQEILRDAIVREGEYSGRSEQASDALQPFFEAVFDAGHLRWA